MLDLTIMSLKLFYIDVRSGYSFNNLEVGIDEKNNSYFDGVFNPVCFRLFQ